MGAIGSKIKPIEELLEFLSKWDCPQAFGSKHKCSVHITTDPPADEISSNYLVWDSKVVHT
jgi:hypothetical protein